jgi:hypothetical protein
VTFPNLPFFDYSKYPDSKSIKDQASLELQKSPRPQQKIFEKISYQPLPVLQKINVFIIIS